MINYIIKDEITRGLEKAKAKHQERFLKKAYRDCGKVIQTEAKKNLKGVTNAAGHKNKWNQKRLDAGIKVSVGREVKEGVKVHIMGDFRLPFFEMGTVNRQTTDRKGRKRKGHFTGRMKETRFFKKAVDAKTDEVIKAFNTVVGKIIDDKNLKK